MAFDYEHWTIENLAAFYSDYYKDCYYVRPHFQPVEFWNDKGAIIEAIRKLDADDTSPEFITLEEAGLENPRENDTVCGAQLEFFKGEDFTI